MASGTSTVQRPKRQHSPYLADVDPQEWNWRDYLRRYDKRFLRDPDKRRTLCRLDPLLFAVLYLRKHLASEETNGEISISQFHVDLCVEARTWARKRLGPAECRDGWIAPRGSGKSTWVFLILPLWAMAHRHRRYIAAFANSGTQAQQHLMSLKMELDNNALLRRDHSGLCRPATRGQDGAGVTLADRQDLYLSHSGCAFSAKGIDSGTLGAKVGSRRPDVLLFDDVEPDESNYTPEQKEKRLATVLNAVFPMNLNAVVVLAGTTTMQGSIIHDLVRQETERDDDLPTWPQDEKIRVHYYHAIVTEDDGTQRSLWPQRWSLEYLLSICETASFFLNFANQPVSSGGWWERGQTKYAQRPAYDRVVMVVDGAVTIKKKSDSTGISVGALSVGERKVFVREAIGVKLGGEQLRAKVLELIVEHDVDYLMVESNQGGDLWHMAFHDMPIKVVTFSQSEPKPVRIRRLLALYQRAGGSIFHEKKLPQLEREQAGYPKILHEDVLDATAAVAEHLVAMLFRQVGTKDKALVHQFSYRQGR